MKFETLIKINLGIMFISSCIAAFKRERYEMLNCEKR